MAYLLLSQNRSVFYLREKGGYREMSRSPVDWAWWLAFGLPWVIFKGMLVLMLVLSVIGIPIALVMAARRKWK